MALVDLPYSMSIVEISSFTWNLACLGAFIMFLFWLLRITSIPGGNHRWPFSPHGSHAREEFSRDAYNFIKSGLKKSGTFWTPSDNGPWLVLSPKYATEIRNHPDLSLSRHILEDFHGYIRGFEPTRISSTAEFSHVVQIKLTQNLGILTQPLVDETNVALSSLWTEKPDWLELTLGPNLLRLVAQISSRAFTGNEMCRDPDWLNIVVNFTLDSYVAVGDLNKWPRFIRPLVAEFLPSCQKYRQHVKEARKVMQPILDKRRMNRGQGIPEGYIDAIRWMEESANGRPYDIPAALLAFANAAIHTTSDMMSQVLFDLCNLPDVVENLRQEVVSVIQQDGWTKTALYKLQLMDSVLKESQRLKPSSITSMTRVAEQNVTLSDGTIIVKGTTMTVSSERMWDPTVYQDPERFDAYRFLRLREARGYSAHSVSSSPEHMGFGFGKHACPGRFFAIHEAKIILSHILLNYDFKLADHCTPKPQKYGRWRTVDPSATICIRRRKETLHL